LEDICVCVFGIVCGDVYVKGCVWFLCLCVGGMRATVFI